MQGDNFVLTDRDRVPSIFGACCMYFMALVGQQLISIIASVLYTLLSYVVYDIDESFFTGFASALYYFLFLLIPFIVYARRHPGISEYIRVKPLKTRHALLCAAIAVPGVLFVTYITAFWAMLIEALGGTVIDTALTIPETAGGKLGMILSNAVLPGVCEELLFRGCMLSAWEEKGSVKAMVIVSVWFALLHASILGIPSEIISGLILAFVVLSTDSLFAGIIYHTAHNAVVLALSFESAEEETVNQMSYFEAAGGLGGCITMFFVCAILGVMIVMLLKKLDSARKDRPFGVPQVTGEEKRLPEIIVVISCIVFAIMGYATDILEVLGVIK